MRLFIGIKLDNIAIKKIDKYMGYLYQNGIKGNYTRLSNIHLTLSFLGEQSEEKVEEIIEIIKTIDISKLITEELVITKTKMLKNILSLEVCKTNSLANVQKDLTQKLNDKGYKLETREYTPHITLVRECNKALQENITIKSKIEKITLFESVRVNNSLVYKELN